MSIQIIYVKDHRTTRRLYITSLNSHLYKFEGNTPFSKNLALENHRGKKTPKSVNSYQYKNNTKVLKSDKNESKESKNASHSIGNENRSRQKTPLKLNTNECLNLNIYTSERNKLTDETNGKIHDRDSNSNQENRDYLENYYTEEGFGMSAQSPLLLDRYRKLEKKSIPVDVESLKALVSSWNRYLDENRETIKLRKGVFLSKHTLTQNKTLLHLQVSITYMTRVKKFNLAEMLAGIESFLNLYLNGHSYDKKANLVDALTLREDTFLKCIDGSIKKMSNFFPIAKKRKKLKYFIKQNLKDLYARNGGMRGIDPEEEKVARTYLARIRYESYLSENTDLTGKEIARKIQEEIKLL